LWHLDLKRLSNPLKAEVGEESAGLSEFQHRATRRFYLRLLLGAYLGLPGKDVNITRRIKGRPELERVQSNGALDFSVARSDDCYLIGVSSGAIIGVDLEKATRRSGKPLALAKRYFSDHETETLNTLADKDLHRAFMHTWACKEAIVKANGLGIANQLCRFTVDVNPDNPPSVLDMQDDDHEAWRLAVARPEQGAIAVVAVRLKSIQLEGFSLR
jgi:4'-phosphopantetheinyl transferase